MVGGEIMDMQMKGRAGALPGSQGRVKELEAQLANIRRKLMSVPEADRHYGYRMRISVGEILDDILNTLRP
jgi:hypothetical protein